MTALESMLERNKDFAASQSAAREPMPRALPNVEAIIIGCADMRVDPAHVVGIKPGEAVVMRNIGGRITPGLLEQLGMLGKIGEVVGAIPGGGGEFHLIVLQHTNCGITYLAGETAMLTRFFQTPLPSTLLCSGRFRSCPASGSYQALSMTWPPVLLRSLCRQRCSARHRYQQLRRNSFCGSRQAKAGSRLQNCPTNPTVGVIGKPCNVFTSTLPVFGSMPDSYAKRPL